MSPPGGCAFSSSFCAFSTLFCVFSSLSRLFPVPFPAPPRPFFVVLFVCYVLCLFICVVLVLCLLFVFDFRTCCNQWPRCSVRVRAKTQERTRFMVSVVGLTRTPCHIRQQARVSRLDHHGFLHAQTNDIDVIFSCKITSFMRT